MNEHMTGGAWRKTHLNANVNSLPVRGEIILVIKFFCCLHCIILSRFSQMAY